MTIFFIDFSCIWIVFPITFSFCICQLLFRHLFFTINISFNTIFCKIIITLCSTILIKFLSKFQEAFCCLWIILPIALCFILCEIFVWSVRLWRNYSNTWLRNSWSKVWMSCIIPVWHHWDSGCTVNVWWGVWRRVGIWLISRCISLIWLRPILSRMPHWFFKRYLSNL